MVKGSLGNCLKYGIDGRRNMGIAHYHSLVEIQLGGLSSQVLMVLASNTSRMNA
jgi:hypothetical protein